MNQNNSGQPAANQSAALRRTFPKYKPPRQIAGNGSATHGKFSRKRLGSSSSIIGGTIKKKKTNDEKELDEQAGMDLDEQVGMGLDEQVVMKRDVPAAASVVEFSTVQPDPAER